MLLQRVWLVAALLKFPELSSCATLADDRSEDNSTDDGYFKNNNPEITGSVKNTLRRWLACLFLLGAVTTAQAGEFCSADPFFGTIDGSNPAHLAALGTQITIDTGCTFVNFPAGNELTVTLNFQTNDDSIYLITFDNVVFTGNMACANIDHRIWFVNGSDYGTKNNCQDLFIPVEAINKQNPVGTTTVGIGDPFTYTLRIPVLYDPVTGTYINNAGSANDLHSITVRDDLNATGANLTLVGTPTVTWAGSGIPVSHAFTNVGGLLTFDIDPGVVIPAGDQIEIAITVVADNTNVAGTQIVNTATWEFGRLINIDLDGDGIPEPNFFDPLPGENGVTDPMTIGEPDLVVTKSAADTALNLGISTTFTIDVQNNGGSNAWQSTIVDQLPDGMCDTDPTATVNARVYAVDGTTPVSAVLTAGVDYTINYNGPPPPGLNSCQLTFTMLTPDTVIGPTERLIITYQTQLDADVVDASTHTNVAGATQWFSGDGSYPRTTYNRTLSDGTVGVADHEDSHTITAALTGYIFQKTVQNMSTGANPATSAAPGDTLRYRLRLYNFTYVIDDVSITDTLDPARFDLTTFNMVTPPPAGATFTFNNVTGLLQIVGNPPPLNLLPPQELVVEFEIDLLPTLTNGTVVSNQATFNANGPPVLSADSDDPYVNGIAAPGDPGDPTNITIQAPGPLNKTNNQATATIGQQFTYTVTIPATPVNTPLYDVRILDDLTASSADMSFVSATVVSGGTWSLTNTGTSTAVVLQDISTGIDIPANGQAVIAITVQLSNTLTNQRGLIFSNSASYTYNRTNGNNGTQTPVALASSGNMSVVEPGIATITKTVNNPTPSPGNTVRYTVTLAATGGAGYSDVFDVTLVDTLPLGLVYAGNPTVSAGSGVGADNAINAPDITGDGVTTAQTLVWGVIEADIDIQAGDTVTIAYDVQVAAGALYNQTYTNNIVAQWTGLDGSSGAERDGSDGVGGLNDYITSDATVSITTPPQALAKQNTQSTAAIGDQFRYRITVPATPQSTALYDVRITDNLAASAADMTFVSVTKVSGSQPWIPANTGTATNLVIEDTTNGIDIPAGEQIVIDIIVELSNTPTNIVGLTFTNTANYTFNQVNNNPATQRNGFSAGTGNMTIIGPENITLEKSGPATMRIGTPGTFTLNIHNTGTGAAYDLTIRDEIPNPTAGGMCDVAPTNFTAQLYLNDGVTTVGAPLVEGADFSVNFIDGTPSCTLTFTAITPAAAVPADHRLIITYDATLDTDTANGTSLTNIAAVTEWFSGDTAGSGATGDIRTYTRSLTDGSPSTLDHEDAYTVAAEAPIIQFQKYVVNATTGQDPGANASPGDTLRYRIVATNTSAFAVPDFSITDEIDRLNSPAVFAPGTLTVISAPATADTSNTNPNGGAKGTGILDVRNLSLDAAGGANDSITIEFEVTLAAAIDSGTVVLNQALLQVYNLAPVPSDDPNLNGVDDPNIPGGEDPNETLIASAPLFRIFKTSDDLTGSAAELYPGDTLRYTITVQNIGNENAVNAILQDAIPANTTYREGTTTLNGVAVSEDLTDGISPIESGMLINSLDNSTTGFLTADATATTTNVATITFEVTINADTINGTIISNQAYLNAQGAGNSGAVPLQLSDDPDTAVLNDPTRDIVGELPLVDAIKTVALAVDNSTPGVVDPGDTLRYTITVTNYGGVDATNVIFTDAVPANTTYVADSVYLNGLPVGQPDAGVSPLVSGIPISSSDLTPPLPAVGYLSPGGSATITFDVMVNAGTPSGTVISNQGFVANNETPVEPTDADGLDNNGDQPTLIAVGNGQALSISKSVSVVGSGPAIAGGQLEYVIRVTNVGTVPATDVAILDDLDTPIPDQMTYISGTARLNGLPNGIVFLDPTFTVDYAGTYGLLLPGQVAEFRFQVQLDSALAIGQTVTNIGQVNWNAMTQMATATVSIDIGATPGVANLNGSVWHDANFDDVFDSGERALENWIVEIYFKGNLLDTVTTDVDGNYYINGLAPNYYSTDRYELRFVAAGAGPNAAKLGMATSAFTNDLHRIYDIITYPNTNLLDLNLPIDPNGVVYDSVVRVPIAGATVTMLDAATNAPLPATCFDDPAQQNQVTARDGYYKFDINFSEPECNRGSDYLLNVTPPAAGYVTGESFAIPAVTDATTPPFSVPLCLGGSDDAIPGTPIHCEVLTTSVQPALSVAPGSPGTNYHLHLTLDNGQIPGESQLFNNHIPLDPDLGQVVTITKKTPVVNVSRGELVPYTITVNNTLPVALPNVSVIDLMPPGFKYVEGSARLNGVAAEPVRNNRELIWNVPSIGVDETYTIDLLLIVGAGVSEGEYVNRASFASAILNQNNVSAAAATVRVVPDPTFDCSDVIGKVFDDRNKNGYQDENEPGIAGARIATAQGLLVTTDQHGRFHVTCAAIPDEQRGSNFILKLDERSLPSGYRVTTENPRVQRLTRGKMTRFNFGATVHHVVTLSVADGVFKSDSAEMRPQWTPRLGLLIEELRKQASVLRITYLADVERAGLVNDRMTALKARIQEYWKQVSEVDLVIETEVFWRHGGPVDNKVNISDDSSVMDYVSSTLDRNDLGSDTERQLPNGYAYTPWMQDPEQFKLDEEVQYETRQVTEKIYTTKKLADLVPPILFSSGKADISEEFVSKLREILDSMRDRVNVRLHFIGHTDNVKLQGALKDQYEDNMGLSKERAGTTAEFFQRALELPPEAISYEGMGETKPVANNDTEAGRAQNRRVEVQVWYDEVSEELVDRKVEVDQDVKRIMVCRVETVCKLRYKEGHSRRTKLKNLVPPFHYDEGVSQIPAQYLQQLKQALQNLSGKDNVQMRFIAYTDNIPLTGRDARIYGDHVGLSKANARRVAIAVQEALGLPTAAVDSTGRGATSPIASNNSEKGRTLNRRIEVEFWHDDPLEDLPEEPQICPEASAAETVERIYNPPEGDIKPIYFENGKAVIPDGYTRILQRAMADISDKGNVRLRFVGYTSNKRLDRRTAMVYGDDIGLSTARARRAMEAIKGQMGLSEQQAEFEGRGYVQSHDVVNTGFVELDRSKVEVQVVYDELAVLDETEGVSIKRITRDVETKNPFALNLMRISVDGQPLNDPNKNIPDVQRCTDVALDKAQVRFKFDDLQIKPRLNVTAWPNIISYYDSADTEFVENLAHFKLYTNYPSFIHKGEVRLFNAEQSTRDEPIAVVPFDEQGKAQWQYAFENYSAPRLQLKYVLRVYDRYGNFDETAEQTLWVVDTLQVDNSERDADKELLVGYGENRLALNNIPLQGGVVSVSGEQVPQGHKVWFAGRELPVSDIAESGGKFGGEFIVPSGLHTVEVAITDDAGNGNVYQRDLELQSSDWFYVGIADITASQDDTSGPAGLVTGNDSDYSNEFNVDGRLAFYAKGRFANDSVLTMSADTREGEIDELFSNFMNKSPEALFRRIDPDYYYPTFGDDSTLEEDAPTSGKFYVKWQKARNYGMWGNFDIAYMDNSLAHVDRGLYGANINYETDSATAFGEKRFAVNLFAAEPGTLAGRDEFLGTGGSLYYLRRQDILTGSERLRIEVRDAVSGLVVGVKNLAYGLDYDIDYIQGRIMLSQPLSASAATGTLVDSRDFGGNDVYLVARYEYTPGFNELNDITTGGRIHYWFNNMVKLGMTVEDQEYGGGETSLNAFDLTVRKNAGTWLKLEQSTSQGPVSSTLLSSDGGFEFNEIALPAGTDIKAKGQRVDASVRLEDIFSGFKGTFSFYNQQLDAGYAAPGLIANTDTTHTGGMLQVPVLESVDVKIKADSMDQENALKTEAVELNVDYLMNKHWSFGVGWRDDKRTDNSPAVPLTQQQGERSDAALRATYNSRENWLAYGYVQDTIDVTGNREDNGRVGVGGDYRFTDRFKLDGELSSGDLGTAVRLGSNYQMTDATDLYTSYALEDERTDNGVKARRGNLASGFKTRYSDSASIYMEERYTHGDVPTGLTHALGFDLAINDKLNFGGDIDVGSIFNNTTGAETKRKAMGIRVGYKFQSFTYAGALEYRVDETEQSDTTSAERTTWLVKNSIKYQLSADWRLIGKLNHSQSESSLGDFYDGNFTEAVVGYAFRPVSNDALNALFKYTYFYNMPTTDQVALNNSATQYIQKSHILSVDAMYDITRSWTIGGKYAQRIGKLSLDRENPQFFDSGASLYILRADWHFTHRWDALLEGRLLDVPDAGDSRSGLLFAIYRHFNSHVKVGVGYNFTDFSDDLTDLDYDSQGLFINAIGKF
ncbi:isopeptide-forming domain-containing fimbrial protein [Kaarinaea lacus]